MRFSLLRASAESSFPYCFTEAPFTQHRHIRSFSSVGNFNSTKLREHITSAPYPLYTSSNVTYGCTNSMPSTKSDTCSSEMSSRVTCAIVGRHTYAYNQDQGPQS